MKRSTKEEIMETALQLFNQFGFEFVGMRELAKELGVRPGNLTYYFPTKDALAQEISARYVAANNALKKPGDDMSLASMAQLYKEIFNNQYRFRCLFISMPALLSGDRDVNLRFAHGQFNRRDTVRKMIKTLVSNGYLTKLSETQEEAAADQMVLISRHWIADARITRASESAARSVSHYLNLFMQVLGPYCTAKGSRQMLKLKKEI